MIPAWFGSFEVVNASGKPLDPDRKYIFGCEGWGWAGVGAGVGCAQHMRSARVACPPRAASRLPGCWGGSALGSFR